MCVYIYVYMCVVYGIRIWTDDLGRSLAEQVTD